MKFDITKQQKPEYLWIGDEVEVHSAEDSAANGRYTVETINSETGDITLVGANGSITGNIKHALNAALAASWECVKSGTPGVWEAKITVSAAIQAQKDGHG